MAVLATYTEDHDVELDITTVTQSAVTMTTGSTSDVNYARGSFVVSNSTQNRVRSRKALTPVTEFWFHGNVLIAAMAGTNTLGWSARSRANSEVDQFRLVYTGTGTTVQFQRNSAGSFVSLGSSFSMAINTLHTIDIYCKIDGTSGVFQFYLNGTLVASFSGSALQTQHNVVDSFTLGAFSTGASSYWSECVVADESTVGWRVKSLFPNGAGNQNDFSSSFSAIDEFAIDLGDFAASNTVNHLSLYTYSNLNAADAFRQMKALVVTSTILRSADSTPTDAQIAIRSGGTNAFSSSVGLSIGRNDPQLVYATNPVTSTAWSAADIDALEIGLKAV